MNETLKLGSPLLTDPKCDRRLPSCTQCTTARTACTGFSVTASTADIPRSVVRHLEYEIARLETELAQGGHLDALNGADILLQMPIAFTRHEVPDFNEQPSQTTVTIAVQEGCKHCNSSREMI